MNSIRLEWKQERGGLFVWLFFMVLIMGMMMAMFPVMANQGMEDILTTKLDAMPPEMLEAFSLTNGASLLQATGFFAYIFQYLFLAACIFATMKGAQALIEEETNGTIEYLYAQPISRKAIVTSKYIANLVLLMIFWMRPVRRSFAVHLSFQGGWSRFCGNHKRYHADFRRGVVGIVVLLFNRLPFLNVHREQPFNKRSRVVAGIRHVHDRPCLEDG